MLVGCEKAISARGTGSARSPAIQFLAASSIAVASPLRRSLLRTHMSATPTDAEICGDESKCAPSFCIPSPQGWQSSSSAATKRALHVRSIHKSPVTSRPRKPSKSMLSPVAIAAADGASKPCERSSRTKAQSASKRCRLAVVVEEVVAAEDIEEVTPRSRTMRRVEALARVSPPCGQSRLVVHLCSVASKAPSLRPHSLQVRATASTAWRGSAALFDLWAVATLPASLVRRAPFGLAAFVPTCPRGRWPTQSISGDQRLRAYAK